MPPLKKLLRLSGAADKAGIIPGNTLLRFAGEAPDSIEELVGEIDKGKGRRNGAGRVEMLTLRGSRRLIGEAVLEETL